MTTIGSWRSTRAADLPAIAAISDAAHGGYTERPEFCVERLAPYLAG